jgi:Na+-driven multidrug efflux pump
MTMKKVGLATLGVAGACAACCAIPLAIPIIGALSVSGLSMLAVDQLLQGPTGIAVAMAISLAAAVGVGVWYVAQRRKQAGTAQSRAACSIPDSNGDGGCGCSKGAV